MKKCVNLLHASIFDAFVEQNNDSYKNNYWTYYSCKNWVADLVHTSKDLKLGHVMFGAKLGPRKNCELYSFQR